MTARDMTSSSHYMPIISQGTRPNLANHYNLMLASPIMHQYDLISEPRETKLYELNRKTLFDQLHKKSTDLVRDEIFDSSGFLNGQGIELDSYTEFTHMPKLKPNYGKFQTMVIEHQYLFTSRSVSYYISSIVSRRERDEFTHFVKLFDRVMELYLLTKQNIFVLRSKHDGLLLNLGKDKLINLFLDDPLNLPYRGTIVKVLIHLNETINHFILSCSFDSLKNIMTTSDQRNALLNISQNANNAQRSSSHARRSSPAPRRHSHRPRYHNNRRHSRQSRQHSHPRQNVSQESRQQTCRFCGNNHWNNQCRNALYACTKYIRGHTEREGINGGLLAFMSIGNSGINHLSDTQLSLLLSQ